MNLLKTINAYQLPEESWHSIIYILLEYGRSWMSCLTLKTVKNVVRVQRISHHRRATKNEGVSTCTTGMCSSTLYAHFPERCSKLLTSRAWRTSVPSMRSILCSLTQTAYLSYVQPCFVGVEPTAVCVYHALWVEERGVYCV